MPNVPAVPKEKYKLVLVEDSDDDVVLFELALKRTGLHLSFEIIRRFPNAEDAIEYFQAPPSMMDPEPKPDIVILDIKLPGRNGFDVLAVVRSLDPQPTVAIFTTSILDEDRKKAAALGADVFQSKNFESAEFSRFLLWLAHLNDARRQKRI